MTCPPQKTKQCQGGKLEGFSATWRIMGPRSCKCFNNYGDPLSPLSCSLFPFQIADIYGFFLNGGSYPITTASFILGAHPPGKYLWPIRTWTSHGSPPESEGPQPSLFLSWLKRVRRKTLPIVNAARLAVLLSKPSKKNRENRKRMFSNKWTWREIKVQVERSERYQRLNSEMYHKYAAQEASFASLPWVRTEICSRPKAEVDNTSKWAKLRKKCSILEWHATQSTCVWIFWIRQLYQKKIWISCCYQGSI